MAVAVITMVVTFWFGTIAYQVVENNSLPFPEIFSRWDALAYEVISEFGYGTSEEQAFNIFCLPLFPWLGRPFIPLFTNVSLALMLVANAACLAAFVLFHRLAREDACEETARIGLLSLALFPTAYFLHLGYTESLFLATSIGAFYAARRGCWIWVAVCAFLAGMTRLNGLALLPALFIEYAQQRDWAWRRLGWGGLAALAPLAGFAVYAAINHHHFDDPLHFLSFRNETFRQEFSGPWVGLSEVWRGFTLGDPEMRVMRSGADLLCFLLATIGTVYSFFKLRLSYSVYLFLLWLLAFWHAPWASQPRFMLVMFPLFLLIGETLRGRPAAQLLWGLVSVLLFALSLMHYVCGAWTA